MEEVVGDRKGRLMSEVLNWTERVELEEQSQDLLHNEELELEMLVERGQAIRFPKQVDVKFYLLLVSNVFKNMAHIEYEKVLEVLNEKVQEFDYQKEFNYMDNYVYPEVVMLEAFEKKTIEKFNHLDSFKYNGQEVLIVKPMRDIVYTAKVVTHFPKLSLNPVLETLKKYAVVLKCVSQTYSTKNMVGIYNGNFIISFKLKKGAVLSDIPQLLRFSGFSAKIFIQGQKKRCFRCNGEGHLAFKCVFKKSSDSTTQSRGEIFSDNDFPMLAENQEKSGDVMESTCVEELADTVHAEHTYSRVVMEEQTREDEHEINGGGDVQIDCVVQNEDVAEGVNLVLKPNKSDILDITKSRPVRKSTEEKLDGNNAMSRSSSDGESVDKSDNFSKVTEKKEEELHEKAEEIKVIKKNKRKYRKQNAVLVVAKQKNGTSPVKKSKNWYS